MGLGGEKAYNYLDSSSTLGDILGEDYFDDASDQMVAVGGVSYSTSGGWKDSQGNAVKEVNGLWYQVDDDGKVKLGKELEINGEVVGVFDKDSSLASVISTINSSDAGVTATISNLSGKIVFTSKETGSGGKIDIGSGGLADDLFGATVSETVTTTTYKNNVADTELDDLTELKFTIDGDELTYTKGEAGFESETQEAFLARVQEDLKENYSVELSFNEKSGDILEISLVATGDEKVDVKMSMVKDGDEIALLGSHPGDDTVYSSTGDAFDGKFDMASGTFTEEFSITIEDSEGDWQTIEIPAGLDFEGFKYALNNLSEGAYVVKGDENGFTIQDEHGESITGIAIGEFEKGVDSQAEFEAALMEATQEPLEVNYGSVNVKNESIYDDDSGYTAGVDAEVEVTINGETKTITRSSNEIDLDGLKVTLSKVFGEDDEDYEPITFESEYDTDKVVDVIQQMVDDYNEMVAEIRNLYTTVPNQTSGGAAMKPLTDDERAEMTESEIEAYEEKCKVGILFGDSNMRGLYESLTGVFGGALGSELRAIGLDTSFSFETKSTTLTLDKDKLAEMLRTDLTKVQDIFTRSTDTGASSDGLMASLDSKIKNYANITGSNNGILVRAAGTELSSNTLLDNFYQTKIDSLNAQIEKCQEQMVNKVDYYNSSFTRLEVLMAQMNSQSSALAGLSGY